MNNLPSFTELLAKLPGVKAREAASQFGTCPSCMVPMRKGRLQAWCPKCGYKRALAELSNGTLESIPLLPGITLGHPEYCFYCGEFPEARDHIIPYSYLAVDPTDGSKPGPKVYSCMSCNGILGAKFFRCLHDRAAYVGVSLRQKHRKTLRLPEWTQEQLSGMGYSLRTEIVARQNLRILVERRLAWSESTLSKSIWTDTINLVTKRYSDNSWFVNFISHNPYEARSKKETVPSLRRDFHPKKRVG